MVTPSQPQTTANPFATVEANIAHLPEEEKERQRDAGKGSSLSLSPALRFKKLVAHNDPSVPPTVIEVTAQVVTVDPDSSTYQLVTADGPVHARTGDILITDPWDQQWIVSRATFDSQGHQRIGPAETPDHEKDDA